MTKMHELLLIYQALTPMSLSALRIERSSPRCHHWGPVHVTLVDHLFGIAPPQEALEYAMSDE